MAATVWVVFDHVDNFGELIHASSARSGPVAPLCSIDPPQITIFIRPFVPDRDFVVL